MSAILAELRDHFRESTRPRIADMQLLVAAIRCDARDASAVDQLARHFHALAGLGGSYGFAVVSTLADEGEGTAMPFARAATAPSDAHVERWSELVAAIAREIA